MISNDGSAQHDFLKSSHYHRPTATELASGAEGKRDRRAHNSCEFVRRGAETPSSV